MNFGYARVSAKDQNLDTQLEQLHAAGVQRIFQEKISGATTQRPQLDQLLATLREGDTLAIKQVAGESCKTRDATPAQHQQAEVLPPVVAGVRRPAHLGH
jgi:DNA invertase Pin-like site-specific DNA recombinase